MATNKKRDHEFLKEQGGIYGRLWKEKREGENDVILLSSQK